MKLSSRIIPLLIITLALITVSCGHKKFKVPDEYLSPEELLPLLIDIHLADGILQNERTARQIKEDSAFNYYSAIFKKHGVTRMQFDSTIHFYAQYPDEFAKIYDEVMKELSIMEGDRRKKSEETDTVHNTKPDTKPGTKSEIKPEIKPDTKLGLRPKTKSNPNPRTNKLKY